MLVAEPASAVAFRHELARLAIEEALPPDRRRRAARGGRSRRSAAPRGATDAARLAHHAEAAGDAERCCAFAPGRRARAARLGAHREAAAQYARALRFGGRCPPRERAELLERRSYECYLDRTSSTRRSQARTEALERRRELGDRLAAGRELGAYLSASLWLARAATRGGGRGAIELLEELGRTAASSRWPTRTSASSAACSSRDDADGRRVGRSSAARARRRSATSDGLAFALNTLGTSSSMRGRARARRSRPRAEPDLARRARPPSFAAATPTSTGSAPAARLSRARRVASAISTRARRTASEHDLDLWRIYILAGCRAALVSTGAAGTRRGAGARASSRDQRESPSAAITALVVLGARARAPRRSRRRGRCSTRRSRCAEPTGELQRIGRSRAARAEAAWLAGDRERVAPRRGAASRSRSRRRPWVARRARLLAVAGGRARRTLRDGIAEPYALQLAGDGAARPPRGARSAAPTRRRCALAGGGRRGRAPARRSTSSQRSARARRPRSSRVACARSAPRRPARPAAGDPREPGRAHARELEVLALLAEGSATPRSPSGSASRGGPSTTTCRRSCASSARGRAARPSPRRCRLGSLQDR